MTEIELLSKIGNILFGEYWQRPLAGALGVNERTVHRWVAGEIRMLPERWSVLVNLLSGHERSVGRVIVSAEKMAARRST